MSIKPLDMQVMIPKTQKVASIRHLEQRKSQLNQQHMAHSMDQQVKDKNRQVVKSGQNDKPSTEADARKKGRNTYSPQSKKRKKKRNNQQSETSSRHHIDIRI